MFFFSNPHPARKRFFTAVGLGVVAGLICIALVGKAQPDIWDVKNMLFWTLLSDRILIGMMVAFAGAFTVHPIFGWKCFAWFRGPALGALVSLPIAFGALTDLTAIPPETTAAFIFWATVISGAVYGLVIDLVATKVGGEGKALLG